MLKGRSLARAAVLQTIFEMDQENDWSLDFKDRLKQNFKELKVEDKLYSFAESLIKLVLAKKSEIDKIIEKAAPKWPLERIAGIDRNILRIGLSELIYADHEDVPYKVAINEAIELAKHFGGDRSYKFVNGVLATVYKELGEPGKEEQSAIDEEQDVVGAFVYSVHEGEIYVALVHDIFGYWSVVKGKKEEGETNKDALKRKVKEELGIELESIEDYLGNSKYKIKKDNKRILRNVEYFLVKAPFEDISPKNDGGLDDAKWFKLADIGDLRVYDDLLPIITEAINILISKAKHEENKEKDKELA